MLRTQLGHVPRKLVVLPLLLVLLWAPAVAPARHCKLPCQCRRQCTSLIDACIAAGGKRKVCTKQIVKGCKRNGIATCSAAATTTTLAGLQACEPYSADCPATDASGVNLDAQGGQFCGTLCGEPLATSTDNVLSVAGSNPAFVGNATFSVGSGAVFLEFSRADGAMEQVNPDGSIVLAQANAPGGGDILRTLNERVVISKACDIGRPVVGSFSVTFQRSDGSYCDANGQFSFFRVTIP